MRNAQKCVTSFAMRYSFKRVLKVNKEQAVSICTLITFHNLTPITLILLDFKYDLK